jgi:hypothetical protein
MPIALEAGQQYPIVLDSDAAKSKETQPTFLAKSQPMRGQLKVGQVLDLYTDSPDITIEDLFAKTIDVLAEVLCGWKNMNGIAYSKESLSDVLSYVEARELLRKVMHNQYLSHEEKKSLGQQPS